MSKIYALALVLVTLTFFIMPQSIKASADSWVTKAPMPAGAGGIAVALNGKIYVIGRSSTTCIIRPLKLGFRRHQCQLLRAAVQLLRTKIKSTSLVDITEQRRKTASGLQQEKPKCTIYQRACGQLRLPCPRQEEIFKLR